MAQSTNSNNQSRILVGIIMGSDSDLEIMKSAVELLNDFKIPTEVTVVSAHRTPLRMVEYAQQAKERGLKVIIAGAGGAAHLPGMVASITTLPVIGVPIKSSNSIDGWDSVLSILQMPNGVPVATVALNGAKNAGLLATEIIGSFDETVSQKLVDYKLNMQEEVLKKVQKLKHEGLDNFFGGGGIESKAITELYGKFQTGKTQICYCTAITAASNNKKVLFIDTENTYSPTRTQEISMLRGLDVNKVQENIHVSKVSSSSMLVSVIRDLRRLIKENKFELIIIDSIIALHRAEYLGRTFLASRQQGLAEIMGILIRIAERCNIGVIITNQVGDSPDPFKPGVYATGGNIIAHSSTHRIFLKSRGQKTEKIKGRNVKRDLSLILMQDSPRYPRTEKLISIGPDGVRVEDASKMDSKVISEEEE